jgi:hypothetical protein
MLQCNMTTSLASLQYGLEDILGDFRVARSRGDLGRLALLNYCEVRRWAREAQAQELAKRSLALMANFPYANRDDFLEAVDELIAELEHAHGCVCDSLSNAHCPRDSQAVFNQSVNELH